MIHFTSLTSSGIRNPVALLPGQAIGVAKADDGATLLLISNGLNILVAESFETVVGAIDPENPVRSISTEECQGVIDVMLHRVADGSESLWLAHFLGLVLSGRPLDLAANMAVAELER
jgi:hypothetical protein